jgi:SAM-dependent methyltransferase
VIFIFMNYIMKNRESELLKEPACKLRLKYITKMLDSLDLKKGARILDFGGNQFSEYCKKNNYIYSMLDLDKPQNNGTGGYFGGGLTYDGRNIPIEKDSFDVIIISFVLHHTSSNCIHLLKQLKNITTNYLIICEDLCGIEYPITWHERCFYHQKEGIFRSDEEWKFIFESLDLDLIDTLNIRCQRDKKFSDPYKHIYRIQYTLRKK